MIINERCSHCGAYELHKQSYLCNYQYDIYRCEYCGKYSKWDKNYSARKQQILRLLDEYKLNNWDENFCRSLLSFRCLSDKQSDRLHRILAKYEYG